jgi:hypothetical protein
VSELSRLSASYRAAALKMKWHTFAYNFGWSTYVFILDGWIAKCAMAVPIIGYLILFNDSVSQHLSFNKLASEGVQIFGLSAGARLKLIYFGLISVGSANIIYRLRRPFVFKVGTNQFEYVDTALRHFTVSDYIDVHGAIRHEGHHTLRGKYDDAEYDAFLSLATGERIDGHGRLEQSQSDWSRAKNQYEDLLRSMLLENFFRNNVKHRGFLTLSLVLALVGYFLLLVPSADLFVKVLAVSLR